MIKFNFLVSEVSLGNYEYVKSYRNQLTHRNASDELSLLNFDLKVKEYPPFLIKRVIEDYYHVIRFIENIGKDNEIDMLNFIK